MTEQHNTTNIIKSYLALALSKAQGEMESAKKDQVNPFFKSKYADLASVWQACRAALSKNEIAVIQKPALRDGIAGIITKIIHSSGEFEEEFFPLSAAITAKAQDMGSAMKYLRRYALEAFVGVAAEDDDGNDAQNAPRPIKPQQRAVPGTMSRTVKPETTDMNPEFVDDHGEVTNLSSPSPQSLMFATDEQLITLNEYIGELRIPMDTQKKWLEKAGVKTIKDMDSDKVQKLIDSLKEKYNSETTGENK